MARTRKSVYSNVFETAPTPQSQPIPNSGQTKNHAGGYSWEIDDWTRLDRFLLLGSAEGTYYVGAKELTKQNALVVKSCVEQDGVRALNRILEFRRENRSKKLNAVLFSYAMVLSFGSQEVKELAYTVMGEMATTASQWLEVVRYCEEYRKWSRGLRNAFGRVFRETPVRDLAYQFAKYQSNNGWKLNDLLRLTHTVAHGTEDQADRAALFAYAKKGWESVGAQPHDSPNLVQLWAKERAHELGRAIEWQNECESKNYTLTMSRGAMLEEICDLIRTYRLTHEMIPNGLYKHGEIWAALLPSMPVMALIRNLGRLSSATVGAYSKTILPQANNKQTPLLDREAVDLVLKKLSVESLTKARIHPMALFIAHRAYREGKTPNREHRSSAGMAWTPNQAILEALEDGFHALLKSQTPTGKVFKIGVDVSGSMHGTFVLGSPFISAIDAAAAIALSIVHAEDTKNVLTMAFDYEAKALSMNKRSSLSSVAGDIAKLVYGRTNCALPITEAIAKKEYVDTFVVLTDSETWQGNEHPKQALDRYRKAVNPAAKLVVLAVASTGTTIADLKDSGMLNVVGFDANVISLIQEFAVL